MSGETKKEAKAGIVEKVEVPEGIAVSKEGYALIMKGEKGELRKLFRSVVASIEVDGNNIIIKGKGHSKNTKKMVNTYAAIIKNMIKGVREGFTYVLKVCSGHFPMSVAVKGDVLEVKNFIGESVPRTLKLKPGVKVSVNGDLINVEGVDKELVGQVSADIEKMTRRTKYDLRVFQDGIYIINKAGKEI